MAHQRILIICNDRRVNQKLQQALSPLKLVIKTTETIEDALGVIEQEFFDIVLMEISLIGSVDALKYIIEREPRTNGVMITGPNEIESATEAMKSGATDFIVRDFPACEIRDRLELILRQDQIS
ncbi:MAG: response regulator [Desulfobacterales bacterium]|nr:response regulator [Desulfobacterales bacterium]